MSKITKEVENDLWDKGLRVPTYPSDKKEETLKHPDARKHQITSFIKSGIRVFGYVLLPVDITFATVVLVISEMVGIIEELV